MDTNTYIDSISLNTNTTIDIIIGEYCRDYNLTKKLYKKTEFNTTFGYEYNNKCIFTFSTNGKYNRLNFNGLKTYNTELDLFKETRLFILLDYITTEIKNIKFKIKKLDICIDTVIDFNKLILTRTNCKKRRKQHTGLNEYLFYIESNKSTVMNGLLYNKTLKEFENNNFKMPYNVTRCEVVLRDKLKQCNDLDDLMSVLEIYKLYSFNTVSTTTRNKRILNNNGKIKHNTTTDELKFSRDVIKDFLYKLSLLNIGL